MDTIKTLKHDIKQLKEAKHHLGKSERRELNRQIRFLKTKVADYESSYDLMITYKNLATKVGYELEANRKEIELLNRKIDYIHKYYKDNK